ncbi:MAG: hypothetical protein AAGU12_10965 [Clostridiales bacterium]
MTGYLPWDKTWHSQITYLPWVQPELPGMEQSPVLPAYPIFISSLKSGMSSQEFFAAVASTMVFLLGHEPESPLNPQYCAWLNVYNEELASQLFYEGTEMAAQYNLPQAIWMLQASLLLAPAAHESHFNLALAFNQLATQLQREEKYREAGDCYNQAQQYFNNASQLEDVEFIGGKKNDGYDSSLHREW